MHQDPGVTQKHQLLLRWTWHRVSFYGYLYFFNQLSHSGELQYSHTYEWILGEKGDFH